MQAVVETHGYLRQAKLEGMTEAERFLAATMIAENPVAGELIVGSGGCRKVRIPREHGGKSGGYRVVTYYAGSNVPVFLVAVLSKTSRENFTDAEVNAMAKMGPQLVASVNQPPRG